MQSPQLNELESQKETYFMSTELKVSLHICISFIG